MRREPRAKKLWLRLIYIVVAMLMPVLFLGAAALPAATPVGRHVKLYEAGVAVGPDDTLWMVPSGFGLRYLPSSRVLDPVSLRSAISERGLHLSDLLRIGGPRRSATVLLDTREATALAGGQRAWLDSGRIPGAGGPYAELSKGALLDIHALIRPNGAMLAGPSKPWRYVWPRDASFAAVALAQSGHPDDAGRILRYLQRVQNHDGSFEARYLRSGTGPPDHRGIQLDSTGWSLWAVQGVLNAIPGSERAAMLTSVRSMVNASSTHALQVTGNGRHLPPPSPDYWETPTNEVTLGTVTPLLIGLESASAIFATAATTARSSADAQKAAASSNRCANAAVRLRALIERDFGRLGYPRVRSSPSRDAAVTFTLPPFVTPGLAGAAEAWREASQSMVRPAGGLAPGQGWHPDGISWTPQTALYALTGAASSAPGDAERAYAALDWLRDHRTSMGAIPEKVLATGAPAAVAPLTWTNAVVLLTIDQLGK